MDYPAFLRSRFSTKMLHSSHRNSGELEKAVETISHRGVPSGMFSTFNGEGFYLTIRLRARDFDRVIFVFQLKCENNFTHAIMHAKA